MTYSIDPDGGFRWGPEVEAETERHIETTDALEAAARAGDREALLDLLDRDACGAFHDARLTLEPEQLETIRETALNFADWLWCHDRRACSCERGACERRWPQP